MSGSRTGPGADPTSDTPSPGHSGQPDRTQAKCGVGVSVAGEEPLHVRVAESLGWIWRLSLQGSCRFLCPPTSDNPHDIIPGHYVVADVAADRPPCVDALRYVPRFDTDWSATGPLIERYRIDLWHVASAFGEPEEWRATNETRGGENYPHSGSMTGPSPLIAACQLILQLHAAGKLERPA